MLTLNQERKLFLQTMHANILYNYEKHYNLFIHCEPVEFIAYFTFLLLNDLTSGMLRLHSNNKHVLISFLLFPYSNQLFHMDFISGLFLFIFMFSFENSLLSFLVDVFYNTQMQIHDDLVAE